MDWAKNYEHGMHNGGAVPGSQPFYDTYAGVRRLTNAGMEEAHAEAVVNEQLLASGQSASKADIMALRKEFMALRKELLAEIKDVKASIAMWGAGYGLAVIAVVVTLVRLP